MIDVGIGIEEFFDIGSLDFCCQIAVIVLLWHSHDMVAARNVS